jgi:hypothetical protein
MEVKEAALAAARSPTKLLRGLRGYCRDRRRIWKRQFSNIQRSRNEVEVVQSFTRISLWYVDVLVLH